MQQKRVVLGSILLITMLRVSPAFSKNSSGSPEEQPHHSDRRSNAYLAVGIGGFTSGVPNAAILGGADIGMVKGIGANVEGGIFSMGKTSAGFFSPGLSYHPFRWKDSKMDLFVNSGFTLAFDSSGSESLFHVGGGLNHWFSSKIGLRMEFRDHICSHSGDVSHTWQIRLGMTLR